MYQRSNMFQLNKLDNTQSGFTLVEMLVVIAIIAVLFALSAVNLGVAQNTASVSSATDTLLSDLRSQQLLAMSGGEGSTGSQQPYGIYFQTSNYTLFGDATYNSGDPSNYTVNVGPNKLSTTFSSDQVVFEKGDGEVTGFNSGSNTVTIFDNSTSETITINRFGATSVN
jgi:prepilin-type N-terminal cleavage/methylation domain-containing protein